MPNPKITTGKTKDELVNIIQIAALELERRVMKQHPNLPFDGTTYAALVALMVIACEDKRNEFEQVRDFARLFEAHQADQERALRPKDEKAF